MQLQWSEVAKVRNPIWMGLKSMRRWIAGSQGFTPGRDETSAGACADCPDAVNSLWPRETEEHPQSATNVVVENPPAHWRRLKEFLILFAQEHSGIEDYMTSACYLRDKANIAGCTQSDVIEALKFLHQDGELCLEKWDWLVHSFQPWHEWQGESFFERFRLRKNEEFRRSMYYGG